MAEEVDVVESNSVALHIDADGMVRGFVSLNSSGEMIVLFEDVRSWPASEISIELGANGEPSKAVVKATGEVVYQTPAETHRAAPKIEKTLVSVYRERLMCDCGGEFERTGDGVLLSSPPQYPHQCNKCGAHRYNRGESFPRITYE